MMLPYKKCIRNITCHQVKNYIRPIPVIFNHFLAAAGAAAKKCTKQTVTVADENEAFFCGRRSGLKKMQQTNGVTDARHFVLVLGWLTSGTINKMNTAKWL